MKLSLNFIPRISLIVMVHKKWVIKLPLKDKFYSSEYQLKLDYQQICGKMKW